MEALDSSSREGWSSEWKEYTEDGMDANSYSSATYNFSTFEIRVSVPGEVPHHQLITMLSTSKNVLFPGHNHFLTTGADDPTL